MDERINILKKYLNKLTQQGKSGCLEAVNIKRFFMSQTPNWADYIFDFKSGEKENAENERN